jgi:hypothetical protein
MLDKHSFLGSAPPKLSDAIGAGNGGKGVPSVIGGAEDYMPDAISIGLKSNSNLRITWLCESKKNLGNKEKQ